MGLNTMTGNRVLFKIGGQVIGLAQNVEISDDFGMQRVDGLGSPEALEFVPGMFSHNISGSRYQVSGKNLLQLGFVPEFDDWLTSPEFEIEIQDSVTFQTVEQYTGCKFATHSRSYAKGNVIGESFSVQARKKML